MIKFGKNKSVEYNQYRKNFYLQLRTITYKNNLYSSLVQFSTLIAKINRMIFPVEKLYLKYTGNLDFIGLIDNLDLFNVIHKNVMMSEYSVRKHIKSSIQRTNSFYQRMLYKCKIDKGIANRV